MKDEIDFHIWAENLFFDSIDGLSNDQWISEENVLNKSLQKIYAHKTEASWYWFSHHVNGEPLEESPNFSKFSKSEMRSVSANILNDMKEYATKYSDKFLELNLPWIKEVYKISAQDKFLKRNG